MENPYQTSEANEPVVDSSEAAEARKGKIIVLCVSSFLVGFSLLIILWANLAIGQERSFGQLVRFGLTMALCICIYKGHPWARYLTILFCGFAALFAMRTLLILFAHGTIVGTLLCTVSSLGYAASAIALLAFPCVGKFMGHQTLER